MDLDPLDKSDEEEKMNSPRQGRNAKGSMRDELPRTDAHMDLDESVPRALHVAEHRDLADAGKTATILSLDVPVCVFCTHAHTHTHAYTMHACIHTHIYAGAPEQHGGGASSYARRRCAHRRARGVQGWRKGTNSQNHFLQRPYVVNILEH